MALIYFYSGEVSNAEIYAEKAMEKGLISYGEFNPNMTFVYTTYANILEADKKYEEAVALLREKSKNQNINLWPMAQMDLRNLL